MTYYEASLTRLFQQIRVLTVLAVIGGLLVGTILGSVLAINIGRPIRQATQAIHSLAEGERSEVLLEQGPDEIRDLVREVNVLVTRLHSLEQARRQLLANLVHELGRPLGALRSAIQALARGAGEDPQLMHDLTTGMDEEAARLQDILERSGPPARSGARLARAQARAGGNERLAAARAAALGRSCSRKTTGVAAGYPG